MDANASWYNAERVAYKGSVVLRDWMDQGGARKSAMTTGDLYKELLQQASAKSGVAVNWKTALQCSVAFACARAIAEGIAQVPFKLFLERANGVGKDPAKKHPLYDLIANKPNDWQTSFELREMIGLHLSFRGGSFIYKVRGLRGQIVELLPFEPQMVRTVRDGWDLSYEVHADGKIIKVAKDDMWHLRGISWDGVNGLDVIRLAREAIGLALAMEEHSARMFSNGAKPGGALITEATLKEDQAKLLKQIWEEQYAGANNHYKTAVLFGGLKWEPFAMTGVDAQHLEQRRLAVEEICRYFRVMPIMVGHADKSATYASAEQMFLAHVVHTMMPWYARIENSADVNLLTQEERLGGYYTKFIVQALLRGASKDRADFYAKALGAGGTQPFMTVDEIRGLEDLNPFGGKAAELGQPGYGAPGTTQPSGDPSNAN
ncbi:MAG TPA: phage portal protein [Methylophilaceae bacterium]|nr:phage portal protein [Methylophilaceae bacterium]